MFTTPSDWGGYTTLEFDAKISAGEWNGYSICIYNDNRSVLLLLTIDNIRLSNVPVTTEPVRVLEDFFVW
ncbi:MAG: hypothetical protein ACUVRS_07650 [Armatimonadota bacterium]